MRTPATPVVLVTWEDACALDLDETWVEVQPFTWKPVIVETIGFLLHDLPEGVVLTESMMTDFTGQRQQIPRGMIRSMVVLSA